MMGGGVKVLRPKWGGMRIFKGSTAGWVKYPD